MTAPPLIRLGSSCCNLVKCSLKNKNLLRCKLSVVRSLAYTTTTTCSNSDHHVSSDYSSTSETDALCLHLTEKGKLGGYGLPFVINQVLDPLKRERTSTLLFMHQLKESGFKRDLETYMTVVRLLIHWDWGMAARSDNFLNDVIDNTNWEVGNFEVSGHLLELLMKENLIEAVEVLVQVYASAGRFEEALHALSKMELRTGLMVSTGTCNFVMVELYRLEKEDMVESVYRELKRIGLIPNVHTYEILMKRHWRDGCLEEPRKVIEEMEEAGIEPLLTFIGPIFIGFAGN